MMVIHAQGDNESTRGIVWDKDRCREGGVGRRDSKCGQVHRNSRNRACMGNEERCWTRLRANAIFLSPASLLIEFMRSLRRSGSVESVSLRARTTTNAVRTRDVVIHACLQTPLAVADHWGSQLSFTPTKAERAQYVLACAVNAMMGVGSRPWVCSYVRMSSVASIPPINGIETSICGARSNELTTFHRQ